MKLLSTIAMSILSVCTIHLSDAMGPGQQEKTAAAQKNLEKAINTYNSYLAQSALENNADVNYVNQFEGVFETPLHEIVSLLKTTLDAHYPGNFKKLMEIATLLLENGADVNTVNQYAMPVLHHLVFFETPLPQNLEAIISNSSIQFAKLLLKKGAQINQPDEFGNTPLEHATIAPPAIVRFLLNQGANYKTVIVPMLKNAQETAQDPEISEQARVASGNVAQLLQSYQDLDQRPARAILEDAIEQGFTQLVRKSLQAGTIPTVQDLQLAAQQYKQMGEESYKDIGRMLIQSMGLTEQQSRVTKTGVQLGDLLPSEIVELIRTFLQ